MNEYMEVYMAEAKELLDEMNSSLLMLEKNMGDTGLVNSIFRVAHTIKGNSASMGFKRLENLTHGMEDLLQDIREGKVEVDAKIIELLFVCHDFIESGLCTIMQTGSEEDMKIDGILGKLHLIIKEKHDKLNEDSIDTFEKSLGCIDFTLSSLELDKLKMSLDSGLKAYLVKISLDGECVFKSIRVWLWYQEMDAYLTVVKSDPQKPTAEEINESSFVFEGNEIKLLVVSNYDSYQLLNELDKLLDARNICVERFAYTEKMGKQIKLVMTKAALSITDIDNGNTRQAADVSEEKDRLIEIESEFSNDFISEILVQLSKMDAQIPMLSEEPGCINAFNKLSRLFHTIKGLAGFIGNNLIFGISGTTESLIEHYRKDDFKVDDIKIDFFTTSVAYIKKLCDDRCLSEDIDFTTVIEEHINNMKFKKNNEVSLEEKKAEDIVLDNEIHEETVITDDLSSEHSQLEKGLNRNAVKSLENSFMRISTQKIDSLVDMLGELLIQYSLLEQEASERFGSNDSYMNNLLRMAKVIKGIQNISMSLRMVSLKQAFQKIMRVGRDTSAELGKGVEIVITGEETEIDRNIADKLVDPLMHLVRNSVSHGIECEEDRRKKHKAEKGHIYIRSYSKRGYVYIEVEDDGSGLSLERIRSKAVERKLIDPDTSYSNEEIMKLIFLPGFSTLEAVNNISGRGVGMNVVETEIKKVGGKIDIINKPGEGCNFILKIPLNLAVMNGTIVNILGGRYIIPTLYIKQFVKPEASQWLKVKNRKTMIKIRDEVYPIIPVDKVFGDERHLGEEDENMVVIIELEQKFKALPVRSIIGRQEIVAKPLDKELGGLDFVSGASILGDGKVSLILDVEAMFKVNASMYQSLLN